MTIGNIKNALAGAKAARASLNSIIKQIGELEAEKLRITFLPPHTDDIIAAYQRGLAVAVRTFENRLSHHLNDRNVNDPSAAQSTRDATPQILTVGRVRGFTGLFPSSRLDQGNGLMDMSAVIYFQRDRIAADIPALVKRLCPASEHGMRQADRDQAIADLDEQLAGLEQDRAALKADFVEVARMAPSASDAEH